MNVNGTNIHPITVLLARALYLDWTVMSKPEFDTARGWSDVASKVSGIQSALIYLAEEMGISLLGEDYQEIQGDLQDLYVIALIRAEMAPPTVQFRAAA